MRDHHEPHNICYICGCCCCAAKDDVHARATETTQSVKCEYCAPNVRDCILRIAEECQLICNCKQDGGIWLPEFFHLNFGKSTQTVALEEFRLFRAWIRCV